MQGAADRRTAPALELLAVAQAELRDRVLDVILHGVEADSAPFRDLAVAEAVPHGIHDPPLGGSEHVAMARAAARSSEWHARDGSVRRGGFPSPGPPP